MARKARIVTINDKPYRFSKFEMELIESHGITAGMVSKRVKDGWELHEAMDAPEGTRLSEYREKKTIERLEQARLERKLERKRKKEAELRRKKPHLFNVPQKHPRGRYACYLMENDIFVKVKKQIMTDNARKEYLNQFFGSKRYLYQDNERVAHIHVANGNYYFHGHIVPGWQGVKKTFDTAEELEIYIKQHGLEYEKQKQLTLFQRRWK